MQITEYEYYNYIFAVLIRLCISEPLNLNVI